MLSEIILRGNPPGPPGGAPGIPKGGGGIPPIILKVRVGPYVGRFDRNIKDPHQP